MSEIGKEKARAMIRLLSVEERVRETGQQLISVIVDGEPGPEREDGSYPSVAYEQHVAVWVEFGCECGKRWGAAKLEGDPDPPHDRLGEHAGHNRGRMQREEILRRLADGRERTRAELLHEARGDATSALSWSTIGAELHALEREGVLASRPVFVGGSSAARPAYRLAGSP